MVVHIQGYPSEVLVELNGTHIRLSKVLVELNGTYTGLSKVLVELNGMVHMEWYTYQVIKGFG